MALFRKQKPRGYRADGLPKSERALDAEEVGRLPARELAARLGVSVPRLTQFLRPREWHHIGKALRKVSYYDGLALLVADGQMGPDDLASERGWPPGEEVAEEIQQAATLLCWMRRGR